LYFVEVILCQMITFGSYCRLFSDLLVNDEKSR
jgi:hypothetical protein